MRFHALSCVVPLTLASRDRKYELCLWEQRRKKPWQTDDGLRLVGMMIRLKEKGTTLTWGPRLSSDPGSEAIAAPAAAAVVVAATGAPGGDHPQMVVMAAGPED